MIGSSGRPESRHGTRPRSPPRRWSLSETGTASRLLRGAQAVFGKLVNAPERRLVQIGEATHFVLLEKNRQQLYREVQEFLNE